jgi:predicted ribosome quality control (RQC) complex YloA/Tae2 family protein
MSTGMTAQELSLVAAELQQLVGLPVQRVAQSDAYTVHLRLMRRWLTLSAHPRLARVHLSARPPRALPRAPAFCMLLRKQLLNRPLTALRQPEGERMVELDFPGARLVAELFGQRADLLLLDHQRLVLATLRPSLGRHRPGSPWSPPAARGAPGRAPEPRFTDSAGAEVQFGASQLQQRRERLERALTRQLRKARRTQAHIQGDLDRCADAEKLRRWADLLLAFQSSLPARGQDRAQVSDLFADGEPITIPLDPALDVVQNAEKLYRRQRRLEAGRAHAARRLERAQQRVQELEQLASRARDAGPDELDALEDRAEVGGGDRSTPQSGRSQAAPVERLPYRAFEARDGTPILIGRGARDNHQLTFRHARGRDLWLHTRDLPGAHGVIRRRGPGPVAHETLLDAATLVAHYSKVKPGEDVELAYTERKNVRPARGKPGQVYISDASTLHLVLDAGRLGRLLGRETG